MCGVCGVLHPDGRPVDSASLLAMSEALEHRGPDDEGIWIDGSVGLAHRRLAIIDLDPRAKGPISNEDGTVVASYNGEIYNFQELRDDLLARGHRFRSRGDSEVLVHLWEEHGPEMAARLRGMYAFAVWDCRKKSLYLCRDRVGQKPLYLHRAGGLVAFASEIPALLQCPGVPRETDPVAIHHYLTLQYVPHPLTAWRGIEAVPPATWLLWEQGGWRQERYWDLDYRAKLPLKDEEEYVEGFRERFLEAVRLRLVSDVPLGAFLSGGVDSGMVVAAMARLAPGRVRTFTIGFPEQAWDERRWARMVAERYGTEHVEEVVRPEAAEEIVPLVRRYGQPFADASAIPTLHVSRLARRHVTVALNGDGGDEGFAGYQRYQAEKLVRIYDRLPRALRRGLLLPLARAIPYTDRPGTLRRRLKRFVLSAEQGDTYLQWIAFFDPERRAALYRPDFARLVEGAGEEPVLGLLRGAPADHWLEKVLYTDIHTYLPDDLLVKVDIASMAVSLEARSPFLDHEVLEFAAAVPASWKLRGFTTKALLKRAARPWLPTSLLKRRKMGFGVPLERWLRGELREMGEDLLLGPSAQILEWFRRDRVEELWTSHQSGRADHSYRLWALLVLETWLRDFRPAQPAAGP